MMPANLPVLADELKGLRETLCLAQAALRVAHSMPVDRGIRTDQEVVDAEQRHLAHLRRLQWLIAAIDVHRPLGEDGKHGDLHTPTCGCEDRRCGQQHTMVDGGSPCIAYGPHVTHITASGKSWQSA